MPINGLTDGPSATSRNEDTHVPLKFRPEVPLTIERLIDERLRDRARAAWNASTRLLLVLEMMAFVSASAVSMWRFVFEPKDVLANEFPELWAIQPTVNGLHKRCVAHDWDGSVPDLPKRDLGNLSKGISHLIQTEVRALNDLGVRFILPTTQHRRPFWTRYPCFWAFDGTELSAPANGTDTIPWVSEYRELVERVRHLVDQLKTVPRASLLGPEEISPQSTIPVLSLNGTTVELRSGEKFEVGEVGAALIRALSKANGRQVTSKILMRDEPQLEGKRIGRDVRDKLPIPVRNLILTERGKGFWLQTEPLE